MAWDTSISLGEHFAAFVEQQIRTGRYDSPSDVVRAGLRLLEDQQAKMADLEAALIEGEKSGLPEPFDNAAFLAEMRLKHAS